jgi:hypothetical protein
VHSGQAMQAVVQTFHVDREHLRELKDGVREAVERLARSPDFGGLLCLERGGLREQIIVVVLWRADAMDDIAAEVEDAHRRIAASTDLGVTTQRHRVVRLVAGATDRSRMLKHWPVADSARR